MPLQWLPLQQRQQIGKRSPVSEALTPQRKGTQFLGTMDTTNTFVERMRAEEAKEAERKYNEKMMKMQHEQEMEKLKFAAAAREDERKGVAPVTAGEALGRAPAAPTAAPLTKENIPEAAKEMYELLKTLPDEMQNVLLQQIFTPTAPGGTISSAGKTVTTPEKYNPIAGVFISKGWATVGAEGKPILSEPEREFEKATFEIVEKGGKVYQLNTATGERKEIGTVDEPEGVVDAINKQANADALALQKVNPDISFEDAKHDALIDYKVDPEVAADMAKVKEIPKGDEGKGLIERFINWIKGEKKLPEGWAPKGAGAVAKPIFNEANVSALANVISDDVTEAERAHYKSEGASDADINEAIKRKTSE